MKLRELKSILTEYDRWSKVIVEGEEADRVASLDDDSFDDFEVVELISGQCGGDPLEITVRKEENHEQTD